MKSLGELWRTREFRVSLLFLGLGGLALWLATHYRMGSLAAMGPGYFPAVLSTILIGIGLLSLIKSATRPGEALDPLALRPILFILISVLVTGWTLTHLGAVLALPILLGLSAFADRELQWRPGYLLYIVVLTGLSILLFVELLGLPIPLFGTIFR